MFSLARDTSCATLRQNSSMKTKHPGFVVLAAAFSLLALNSNAASFRGLIAHEWGTFTSVQGSDGTLLSWRPLETSGLPGFVYDWRHPGLNRQATGQLL